MIPDEDKDTLNKETYTVDDSDYVRSSLENKVQAALKESFPLEYGGVRLEVKNINIPKLKRYTLGEQKKALLQNKYLANSIRGDLYLYDAKTGELLDVAPERTLMRVPYYTERGTFIHNGNEYNTLRQMRLRPGVYSRRKSNGELESQFNVERGTGNGFRVSLDPSSGIYKLNLGQSSSNLYSILHDLGISDEELESAWGPDILARNKRRYDPRALAKVHSKLVPKRISKATNRDEMIAELKEAFDNQQIDEEIKLRNLG